MLLSTEFLFALWGVSVPENELAAFYEAVFRRYGSKEASKAAQDWIEELETMDWPADWALPQNLARVPFVERDFTHSLIRELIGVNYSSSLRTGHLHRAVAASLSVTPTDADGIETSVALRWRFPAARTVTE
jgi:hypothetical protein